MSRVRPPTSNVQSDKTGKLQMGHCARVHRCGLFLTFGRSGCTWSRRGGGFRAYTLAGTSIATMASGKPTYLWAAEHVLRKHGHPLRAREIVSYAHEQGLFTDEMHSRTPQKSMQARLSLDILNKGDQSLFVRTAPGEFWLRESLAAATEATAAHKAAVTSRSIERERYVARRRAPSASTERVLSIPKPHYDQFLTFQGLRRDDGAILRNLVRGPVRYIARVDAERTDDHKQVVTYVLVTHGARVLSFRRGTFNRAAAFLRGSSCIGFGGHVAESDLTIFTSVDAGIRANAERELSEEVVVSGRGAFVGSDKLEILGIINDDSTEVGRRHVGVVVRYEVGDADWAKWEHAQRGEASINQLRWINILSDAVILSDYEYWSQLCWRTLFPVVVKAQPSYRILRKKHFRGPHILVVAGSIGSGKTLATRYLSRAFGYAEVNSGRHIARLLGVPPVPETPRADFQELTWRFMQEADGPNRLAEALLNAAAKSGSSRVVIDGIRQLSTLRALKEKSEVPLAVMVVHAAPDVAFELFAGRERHRGEEQVSLDVFMKMLSAPVERDVPFMISEADVVVYNWSGEVGYGKTLSAMADELGLNRRAEKR
jgi:predicted NUDIX family phosphoesterase/dephospho-CoA kinase